MQGFAYLHLTLKIILFLINIFIIFLLLYSFILIFANNNIYIILLFLTFNIF